jgi:hypothetical protein
MSEVGRSVRAMADPVGIISLVLTPTVVARYSLVQKRYELQRTDLQELRTVLDNASERLAFASRALEGWAALTRRAVKHPDGPEAIEVRRAHADAAARARAALDRVGIRAGRGSDVYFTYYKALHAIQSYSNALVAAFEARGQLDPKEEARMLNAVYIARKAFIDSATGAAGTTRGRQTNAGGTDAAIERARQGEDRPS